MPHRCAAGVKLRSSLRAIAFLNWRGRHSPGYSEPPFPAAAAEFELEAVVAERRGRPRLLVRFLALFAFAPRLVFVADRFFRLGAPGAPIRKSSRSAPSAIFSTIHFGMAPRPAHVFLGLSGSRYFGAILRPDGPRPAPADEPEPPPSR